MPSYAGSSMSQPRTNAVAAGLAVFCFAVGAYVSASINRTHPAALGVLAGLYCLLAIKVADQWQKVAVLRLGRYVGLRGPGLFFIVPFIDRKSTRLNSSHANISYAVFCLKKKKHDIPST